MSHPTFELSWGWVGVVTKNELKISFVVQISQPLRMSQKLFCTQNNPICDVSYETDPTRAGLWQKHGMMFFAKSLIHWNVVPRFLLNFFTNKTPKLLRTISIEIWNHYVHFEYWTISEIYFRTEILDKQTWAFVIQCIFPILYFLLLLLLLTSVKSNKIQLW